MFDGLYGLFIIVILGCFSIAVICGVILALIVTVNVGADLVKEIREKLQGM